MSDLLERIAVDGAVMMGKPCIRGTRVTVETVLDALCVWDMATVGDEYGIKPEDVEAALQRGCAPQTRSGAVPLNITRQQEAPDGIVPRHVAEEGERRGRFPSSTAG